jgi:3-(3-hydroxy-phenyl)propionate hydroxylase
MAGPRKHYAFRPPPELEGRGGHYPVVIAGAGPIGMAAARDLALRGIRSIVLDDDDKVSVGSRAICWARRTLEIFDRLRVADRMMQKGVTWNTGRVFCGDDREPVYSFDLSPDRDQCYPAFINLQQYHVEEYLVELLDETPLTELRWRSRVTGVRQRGDGVEVTVETPAGPYTVTADYLLAADGCRSTVRGLLGLEFVGDVFQDHFLIADIRMQAERPAERWFWFDPPFARGQSALLHKQPDDIWRLDFQLGWNIDRELELQPDRVRERVRRMLGEETAFELEWVSIYTFQCRRLQRFVHDRVIFAGDAAHLVSPFGARGANSGVQDVDNLCWKLALVLDGDAPASLLESYAIERSAAADENIRHSTRSTEFITPKSATSRAFRDAVLELARDHPFARAYVNSGRLSLPSVLRDSPLHARNNGEAAPAPTTGTAAAVTDAAGAKPTAGSPAINVPVAVNGHRDWLLRHLDGRFHLVCFGTSAPSWAAIGEQPVPLTIRHVIPDGRSPPGAGDLVDVGGKLASTYGVRDGDWLLFRPDQHLAARGHGGDLAGIRASLARCCGLRAAA